MVTLLEFAAPPALGPAYRRALLPRKRAGFANAAAVPRIEARVTGVVSDPARLAAYRAVCSLAGGDELPLTWPQVLAAGLHVEILVSPAFPASPLGVVHLRNTIVAHRPVGSAEPLDLRAFVEGHRRTERGVEVDLATEATVAGERVWSAVATMLFRDGAGAAKARSAEAPGITGEVVRSLAWRLPADLGRRYARVSGDYNPIHLHALGARLFGFKKAIAHGMWTLARVLGELDADVPAAPMRYEAEFRSPLLLPSGAVFTAARQGGGLRFALRSPDGKRVHCFGRLGP